MVSVGELAGVQVGHQRAGALVAALAAAVDHGSGLIARFIQGVQSLQEVFGGPGVGGFVDVLERARGFKVVVVDDHAVGGHAQGIFVIDAFAVFAGRFHGGAGGDDVILGVRPQIGDVQHLASGAPVGNQAFGAFHHDVGGGLGFDGGGHLVVAGGVVQILHLHLDFGMHGVEVGDDAVHGFFIAPAADGVGPQGDFHVLGHGEGGDHEHHAQEQSEQLLHGLRSSFIIWSFGFAQSGAKLFLR